MYKSLLHLFIIGTLLIPFITASGQVEKEHLKPLLSGADQKKIEKIDVLLQKGKNIENEADILLNTGSTDKEKARSEKKYTLKRLEAAEHYQEAYALLIELMKDNISSFRKNNKKLQVLTSVKNKEDRAGELHRNARSLRKMAEDLMYPSEKLVKVIEAEHLESEASATYVKVLYAYLNQPLAYDFLKPEPTVSEKPATIKPADTIQTLPKTALPVLKPAQPEQQAQENTPFEAEVKSESATIASVHPETAAPVLPVTEVKLSQTPVNTTPPVLEKKNEEVKVPDIKPETSVVSSTVTTAESKKEILSGKTNLVFKVQIVASKTQLSKSSLQKIYTGNYQVDEDLESGWYKYSVVTGPDFNDAKAFMEKEKIQGAFIKAYLGNKRIEIKEALSLKNAN